MTSSALVCIHALSSSVPCSWYAGSASRAAIASLTVAPGLICSATCCISAVMRASSSWPQTYVSSRSTVAPRKARESSW